VYFILLSLAFIFKVNLIEVFCLCFVPLFSDASLDVSIEPNWDISGHILLDNIALILYLFEDMQPDIGYSPVPCSIPSLQVQNSPSMSAFPSSTK
jgi:hypothetical protein